MKLHREGRVPLIITVVFAMVSTICVLFLELTPVVVAIIYAVVAFALLVVLVFFRQPVRNMPEAEDGVTAPADGKVVVVERVDEAEAGIGHAIQISIFMSPLNVHMNWIPAGGTVSYFKYHPGKYLVAWHPKSSVLNERTTIVIQQGNGIRIMFRQIAGCVARRIRWYVKEGDVVQQGDEAGFIKFGSRVDVFVPVDSKILVHPGDVVQGCVTQLARFSKMK